MKKIVLTSAFAACILFSGCKKFIDVNDDPNRPIAVQEAAILSPAELLISHSLNAGIGGNAPIIAQQYVQVIALNQPPPNFGTYLQYNVDNDGDWYNIYVRTLNNLVKMNQMAEAKSSFNYSGIAKILTAYSLATATDFWGDIPYSEAFLGIEKLTPKYDRQEDIYKSIQGLLDAGIADIAKNATVKPGGDDYFYGGDMDKWVRMAYTLKARYYLRLSKAPGYSAQTQANLAITALNNGMTASTDDLKFAYTGSAGGENPWQQQFLPASTLILASTFVDGFKSRNDPRLSKMIAPAKEGGMFNGRIIGSPDIGSLEAYSIPASFYAGANANNYLVTYSEALFIKAEATLMALGFAAAQPVYVSAVQSHMNTLGIGNVDAASYLATRTLTATNALQRIMEEKFIAGFLSGEGYNDWRRTGFPALTPVRNALSAIPRRMLYPQTEQIANPQPQQTAKLTDKVWWDNE